LICTAMDAHKDDTTSKIGMWLFLLSEILLFGGLFLLYATYRYKFSIDFHHAAGELNRVVGTFNTLILLTSSLTMALSISSVRRGNRRGSILLVLATLLLGLFFLLNKYFEWSAKFHHGIYPNAPILLERSKGEVLFFGLYYAMTGLHGVHVLVGLCLLALTGFFVAKEKINATNYAFIENSGLYWHLVDMIWIFLFPLFYLMT
jgi:cytochrome c oxidase subunit 3